MSQEGAISHGVDALIAKLRNEGVAAGQTEADKLREAARNEADKIVAEAKQEADAYLKKARTDADNYRAAGEEALNTAMRDAVLKMKAGLSGPFQRRCGAPRHKGDGRSGVAQTDDPRSCWTVKAGD